MGFLDRILGRQPDPTLDWPMSRLVTPEFDFSQMRFGRLAFGDSLDAARCLGRPDQFRWINCGQRELLYASEGFQLGFDDGRLSDLCFFLGPDPCLPDHPLMRFSEPQLRGDPVAGARLSYQTTRPVLESLFGLADAVDTDEDETILWYTRRGVTMEFELDAKASRLKRWNLYPA